MSTLLEQTFPSTFGDRLRDACGVTAEFLSDIIKETCRRFPSAEGGAKAARVERLIQAQAWIDAALALIELELPQWQVRRLSYDGANGSACCRGSAKCPTGWISRSKPIIPILRLPSSMPSPKPTESVHRRTEPVFRSRDPSPHSSSRFAARI